MEKNRQVFDTRMEVALAVRGINGKRAEALFALDDIISKVDIRL